MSWITPKTNWVSTDRFNVEDYNRITGNLAHLKIFVLSFYQHLDLSPMASKTYRDYLFAEDLNAIEVNLEMLNDASVKLPIGTSVEFYAGGYSIDYEELNRIEQAMQNMQSNLNFLWTRFTTNWIYSGEIHSGEMI